MPKRRDIRKILVIGSGPIVIGQGCEFDYSGVQACKALKAEGFEIVLVNSNPATIMTDPDLAHHTYIEPINWQNLAKIISIELPDAILSTMGGQTALNCALELEEQGILKKYNVELIGANKAAIDKAEDRNLFRQAMLSIGLDMPRSEVATDIEQAKQIQEQLGFPIIIRPSYTLGGSGGGIAYNLQEFIRICEHGFSLSLNHQLLIEESLLGWKEYELEVIRDLNDNCIIVCTIENLDPMGIHTGDSITVAPAQTLTDHEYQKMRSAAFAVLREIGVQTGGANVQFAVNPKNGRMVVIEMNPRVSRSSALASKATGFPIAKVAALLAVGYTLDELKNDITGGLIPASFEPALDYVVVKIPRFNFDKFPTVNPRLTTQMQAVGEVMAIGSTFAAAMQKALNSLEIDLTGFDIQTSRTAQELTQVGPLRILSVAQAFRAGMNLDEIYKLTAIDPWFLDQIALIVNLEENIKNTDFTEITRSELLYWKQQGFSDLKLAELLSQTEKSVRELRWRNNIHAQFRRIDSCAAEFPASTAYLYSTYEGECEALPTANRKVIVLGSGPNRIGQGIEFDYCCVQAVQALQERNIEAIMINCNPETVSTDYDISDRLYFEPIILEMVLEIIRCEKPLGVILQLGGQTPLKLAHELQANGVKILGTSPDTIDLAEDRGRFSAVMHKLHLQQPEHGIVSELNEGLAVTQQLGFPVMVRPSYVLGGRAMEIVYNQQQLETYLTNAFAVSKNNPVLIDRYLQQAIEIDVDVIADGNGGVIVAGIMQHIEPAGVHSGDSAAAMPPYSLSFALQNEIKTQAYNIALELKVCGLMNVQFAVQGDQIYVLEVNPRASRTVPFVSKCLGAPIAKYGVGCMLGESIKKLKLPKQGNFSAVKQCVFPFIKFAGVDPMLGPEMKSTGEIMAFGANFAHAYRKSLEALGIIPAKNAGCSFVSVGVGDKIGVRALAAKLVACGFALLVSQETGEVLASAGIPCVIENDMHKIQHLIANGLLDLIISTDRSAMNDLDSKIRAIAVIHRVHCCTTLAAANAWLLALNVNQERTVYKLQTLHEARVLENEYA